MRRVKKEVIEVEAEEDLVCDERMSRSLKRKGLTDRDLNGCYNRAQKKAFTADDGLLPKVKEFMVDELYEMWLNSMKQPGNGNHVDSDGGCDEYVSGDEDWEYKMFLDNLREDEGTYVVRVNVGENVPAYIRYEEDDGFCSGYGFKEVKAKKNGVIRQNSKTERVMKTASKRLNTESLRVDHVLEERNSDGLRTLRNHPRKDGKEAQRSKRDDLRGREKRVSTLKKNPKLKAKDPIRDTSPPLGRPSSPVVPDFGAHKCKYEENHDAVDESYQVYLTWLQGSSENSMSFESDQQLNSPDPDIIAVGDNPFSDGDNNPFVPSRVHHVIDDDENHDSGPGGSGNFRFREKLMDILREPYDEEEYHDLLQNASIRRPIERRWQLRGREVTCTTDRLGESLLDKYLDFNEKIQLCGEDRHKILKLLRGFFFYLKNFAHAGLFRPWEDQDCLKIMMH